MNEYAILSNSVIWDPSIASQISGRATMTQQILAPRRHRDGARQTDGAV